MGIFSWDVTGELKFFRKANGFGYASTPKGDVHLSAEAFKGNLETTELKAGMMVGIDLGPIAPGKKTPTARKWNLK